MEYKRQMEMVAQRRATEVKNGVLKEKETLMKIYRWSEDEATRIVKREKEILKGVKMKSVLISIKPKWCELIANGEKTVEVRKTRPNLDAPFKCYIYETKAVNKNKITIDLDGDLPTKYARGSGKVIGEFVCDRIDEIGFSPYNHGEYIPEDVFEKTCLSFDQMYDYTAEEFTYGWHVSDLVVYDTPKELSEFKGRKLAWRGYNHIHEHEKLTRPPQSWCYVEEL